MAEIYLAGGCFWGTEKYLASIRGVRSTQVGYANGSTENPTYQEVCHNHTGHAETVRVTYDPAVVSLAFLLSLFYEAIDPVSVNRQGGDCGTQYRSGIYYQNEADRLVIEQSIAKLQTHYTQPVAVEVAPLANFTPAEEYHQKYLDKNPGGYCHISAQRIRNAAQATTDPADYVKPDAETLRSRLTPLQYEVTQHAATEPPFQNEYDGNFHAGLYVDVTTGEPLFLSGDKFASGCGWPSFTKPADANVVTERADVSHGRVRTEVRSRVGDAHLGHVFDDGPAERGGQRYCINSAAIRFIPLENLASEGYGAWVERINATDGADK